MPTVKSIGRKDTNFGQLISYLHKQEGGAEASFTLLHNIFDVSPNDLKGIEQAFKENNQHRKKWKNGVGIYHEVIAFHPDDTEVLIKRPEILEDMAQVYMKLRAENAIAIACPHYDKDHVHLHVMVSPNEVGKSKSIRLSKQEFQAVRRTLEEYQLNRYSELTSSYVHSRDRNRYESQEKEIQQNKRSHKEWQLEERKGDKSKKERVVSLVEAVLTENKNFTDAQKLLGEKGVEVYRYRGRLQGVICDGKKYRFSSLFKKDAMCLDVVKTWNKPKERENYLGQDNSL